MTAQDLAIHVDNARAFEVYGCAEKQIVEALRLLVDAEEALTRAFDAVSLPVYVQNKRRNQCHLCAEVLPDVVAAMRRQVWDHLADRLGVRQMMSPQRREQFDRSIASATPPPVTAETAREIFAGLARALPEMFSESVAAVFEFLRPHHSKHKTNSELEIGPRVILRHAVCWDYWHLPDGTDAELLALENVLHALDGRGQIGRHYRSDIGLALARSKTRQAETDMLEAKAHKNGSLHLRFKRLDLLAKLNALAGGRRLRPAPEETPP